MGAAKSLGDVEVAGTEEVTLERDRSHVLQAAATPDDEIRCSPVELTNGKDRFPQTSAIRIPL